MSGESEHASDDVMNVFGKKGMNDRIDPVRLQGALGIHRGEIEWRKEFINFDEEDAARLAKLEPVFREHREEIAANFYDNLQAYEQTLEVIGRSDRTVEELKETQRAYLLSLARGKYDEEYFVDRARIGMLHYMLEMPMKHYIGQYGVYYELVLSIVNERIQDEVLEATEEWASSRSSGSTSRLWSSLTGSRGNDGELPDSLERTLREAIDEGMQDVLAILRIMNLDMQMATDAYNYANRRREVDSAENDRRRDEEGRLADEISEILTSNGD